MVLSLAFILLSLPILQGSGLQDNQAQTQTTVTSVLGVVTCLIAYSSTVIVSVLFKPLL